MPNWRHVRIWRQIERLFHIVSTNTHTRFVSFHLMMVGSFLLLSLINTYCVMSNVINLLTSLLLIFGIRAHFFQSSIFFSQQPVAKILERPRKRFHSHDIFVIFILRLLKKTFFSDSCLHSLVFYLVKHIILQLLAIRHH